MPTVEWITSQKGKKKLVVDAYLFESNGKGKTPNVKYWNCLTSGCKVNAKTNGDNLTDIKGTVDGDHGHANHSVKLAGLKLKVSSVVCNAHGCKV